MGKKRNRRVRCMQLLANPAATNFSSAPENDSSLGRHGFEVEGKRHAWNDLVGFALLDKEKHLAFAGKQGIEVGQASSLPLEFGHFGGEPWPRFAPFVGNFVGHLSNQSRN